MRPLSNFAPRSLAALAFAFAAIALAPAARAQITVTVDSSANTYEFGLTSCNNGTAIPFTYDITSTSFAPGAAGVTVTAFASNDSTCTAGATTNKTYNVTDQTATTGTIDVPASDFLFGTACSASTTTSSSPGVASFCVQLSDNGTVELTGTLLVNFAMAPPAPPLLASIVVESGDQQLHVAWTPADSSASIASYQIYCEPDGTDFDSTKWAQQVTSGTGATVSSTDEGAALINGNPYSIAISATDSYGNTSPLSDTSEGNLPEPVDDFYQYYRNQGGSALGCASSDGVEWLGLCALALFFLLRWRRPRKLSSARGASLPLGAAGAALLIGAGLFAFPQEAQAEDTDYSGLNLDTKLERQDRRLFLALEFDRYSPQIDSEKDLDGNLPYHDIFNDRIPWRVQAEADWELLHLRPVGTLMAGGSFGFWQNIGHGRFAAGTDINQPSADTTLLDIWPVGLHATFRFDGLADRFRWFPIIPYAKVGLMAALWVVYAGNGSVATSPATTSADGSAQAAGRGEGWTKGYTTALGAAISLDALDPGISNEAYLDLGLQRTSVFAEYGWTRLDGFQSGGVLILTDRSWRFGISLEF